MMDSVRLQSLSWIEAKRALTEDAIVVIPLGAQLKEHGPHLPLQNDWLIAEYFADRVTTTRRVVLAPTLQHHFYPAFVEYAGSVTLREETARDLVVDVVRSLARPGPRRFYILNTGISTIRALKPAVEALAEEGILVRFTDTRAALVDVTKGMLEQEGGTHADEVETSMMLVIAPDRVRMDLALKDYDPRGLPGLSPDPDSGRTHSPTGAWGDPTKATKAKGERIVEAIFEQITRDLDALRAAEPPERQREMPAPWKLKAGPTE